MQSNCGVDSVEAVSRDPDHHGRKRAGLGLLGGGGAGSADRRAERARAGHRRHDGEVLADRERSGADHDRLLDRSVPRRRPAIRSWCRSSTWSRSAMAAGRSPGSTTFGKLHVGPQSAGAAPGPAAYGRGGTRGDHDRRQPVARPDQPRLFLRRRHHGRHGGGRDGADATLAKPGNGTRRGGPRHRPHRQQQHGQRAEAGLAQPWLSTRATSRCRPLAAAGRCMPWRLAQELGVKKVVIPRGASVFSAWGMMMSDLRRDYFVTRLIELPAAPTAKAGGAVRPTPRPRPGPSSPGRG